MSRQLPMQGKVVLITGGTGGIGKETGTSLASAGARVILVGRNQERGEAAVSEIRERSQQGAVELMLADLSSQGEIRRLAARFQEHYDRLDVLINNVGGLYRRRWETADGIEASFAMNNLNPFLLTQLLLPLLKASAPARVINLSTSGHRFAGMEWDDLQAKRWYRGLDVYGRAKLANLLWTYELARRLEGSGIAVHAADPGGALTDMTGAMTPDMVPWFFRVLWPLFRRLQASLTIEKAARSSIFGAVSPELEGLTGQYITASAKIGKSSKASYDREAAQRLWRINEELTGLVASASSSRSRSASARTVACAAWFGPRSTSCRSSSATSAAA